MGKTRALRRAVVIAIGAGMALGPSIAGDASAQPRTASVASRPWLGVSMENETRTDGVRVRHVVRTSPAEKAGIRDGDCLVKIDNVRVSNSNEVIRVVGTHAVGEMVPVTLLRENREIGFRVTLAQLPTSDELMRLDLVGLAAPSWKGIEPVSGVVPSALSGLRGKVVLLDFWATWCGACRFLSPRLAAMQARYGAQGLTVIGLSTEEPEDIAAYAQKMGLSYAIGVDRKSETSMAYHVMSLPSLFVIDRKGVIRDVAVGFDPSREAKLDALVRALLAEPAPAE